MASNARRGRKQQATPRATGHEGRHRGRIVSHTPGRMRVRLHSEHRDPATLEELERQLGDRQSVASVSTDARTGSVLVHYDHRSLTKDDLVGVMRDVGIVALDLLGAEEIPEDLERAAGGDRTTPGRVAEHSTGAVGVLDALTDLDYRISQLTGGKIDLKLLVPASLGLLALRQVAVNGLGLGTVPGYVLLWYTFDSFYKLHQRKSEAKIEEAADQILGAGPGPSTDDADASTPGA